MASRTIVKVTQHLTVCSRSSTEWLGARTRQFSTTRPWQAEPPRSRPHFQDPRPKSTESVADVTPVETTSRPSAASKPIAQTNSQDEVPAAASVASAQTAETTSSRPTSPDDSTGTESAATETSTITTPSASANEVATPPPTSNSASQTQPSLFSSIQKDRNDVMSNALSSIASGLQSKSPVRTLPPYGLQPQSLASKHGISQSGPLPPGYDEYHLSVYSTKHNTHLNLADTEYRSLISISAGNLGFKKSQRGTYDAGYQLMAYMLSRMQQQGIMAKIQKLELCLRGFGQGREAVLKVLTGMEGNRLREMIVRIVDKTRLKIGGNRSPAPRRLG